MSDQRISCPGLDGSNPLTMLAALGLFAIGNSRGLVTSMGWEWLGAWRPFFIPGVGGTRDTIAAAIIDELVGNGAADARSMCDAIGREYSESRYRLETMVEQAKHLQKGKQLKETKQAIATLKKGLKELKIRHTIAANQMAALADAGVAQRHPVTRYAQHLDDDSKGGLSREDFLTLVKEPRAAAYLSGLACDGMLPIRTKRVIARTHLSFANNNSMKMLIKDFAALARLTSMDRVADAVFGAALLRDKITGLGWDPGSQRSYALQFSDPGKDTLACQVVHNALAFLGLQFFTVVPTGFDRRSTVGFLEIVSTRKIASGDADDGEVEEADNDGATEAKPGADFLTWPIWEGTLGYDEVKSLIARPELAAASPDAGLCMSIGVTVILRSRRVSIDKRSYLTNAKPVF
jgi:hypothetical protein